MPPLRKDGGAVAVNESYSVVLKTADLIAAITEMLEYTVMVSFHSIHLSLNTYSWYIIIMHAYTLGRTYDSCQEGELRLRANGGTAGIGGRVAVCFDDFWGTVCDDGWDMNDATIVCRQLGLSGIIYKLSPSIHYRNILFIVRSVMSCKIL